MKTQEIKGTMESGFGSKLSELTNGKVQKLDFSTSVEVFESYDELKAANAIPSNDDIVTFVNQRRVANARQKAMNDALSEAGIERPTLESSEALRIKVIKDALVASGKSEDEAVALAKASLGIA